MTHKETHKYMKISTYFTSQLHNNYEFHVDKT